jgi:hypothetical protein
MIMAAFTIWYVLDRFGFRHAAQAIKAALALTLLAIDGGEAARDLARRGQMASTFSTGVISGFGVAQAQQVAPSGVRTCGEKYSDLLRQMDQGIDAGGMATKICDKVGDAAPDCREAQRLFTILSGTIDTSLRIIDAECPGSYDARFYAAVRILSETKVAVGIRDIEGIAWRGCTRREMVYDANGKAKDVRCVEKLPAGDSR